MKIVETSGVPIKMWLDDIENGALEQAWNLASLPFVYDHVALMPDCHQGYGMPIGGVIATKGVIIPNAVGVDIGCGMCAVKTSIQEISTDAIKKIMGEIRKMIPMGFSHLPEPVEKDMMPDLIDGVKMPIVLAEFNNARTQLGTLGGGNHFIELQTDQDGYLWFMIHSGSRNLGKKICDYYNQLAKNANNRYYSSVPEKSDLAFLPIDSIEGQYYINEMNYALGFAYLNRARMANRVCCAIGQHMDASFSAVLDVHHNYAALENHLGKNVWVHRKGATSAKKDEIGIIPGSQGTKSYIVKGLGNIHSFQSCSHGAGRRMGRKQAERTLNLQEEIKKMDDQGIVHGIRTAADLDEASGAYKDISVVMENQKDLVTIETTLTPRGVLKG